MLGLLLRELELLLASADLVDELTLVKGLLRHNLSSEVLDLSIKALLDSIVLLAHNVTPDCVELVEDVTHAGLIELALMLLLQIDELPDSLRWDPVIVHLLAFLLGAASTRGRSLKALRALSFLSLQLVRCPDNL